MKRILKYSLCKGSSEVPIKGYQATLSVQSQNDTPVLYVIVEDNCDRVVTLKYRAVMTGEEIDFTMEDWVYVGTVMIYSGQFVLHYFCSEESFFA